MHALRAVVWMTGAVAALIACAALALWLGGAPLAARAAVRIVAAKGWDLGFNAVRLRWGDPVQLVLEDARLDQTLPTGGSIGFSAKRVVVEVGRAALLRLAIRVQRLELTQPFLSIEADGNPSHSGAIVADLTAAHALVVRDGRLEYRNRATGARTSLTV